MNCKQTQELLPAYLDNEVAASERRLIQAHLAGCEACQRELALLSQTALLVSSSLDRRAAEAAPSPQAWSRLRTGLADTAQRPPARLLAWFKRSAPSATRAQSLPQGKLPMKTKFALSALALLLVLGATVAIVPPARAQVIEWFTIVFRDPNTPNVTVGGSPMNYQLMQPEYIPEVFAAGAEQISFGETSEIIYRDGDRFLVITQKQMLPGETLPDGEALTVNGLPAVLNNELSGTYQEIPKGELQGSGTINQPGSGVIEDQGNEQPVDSDPVTIEYSNAVRLTFFAGDTKVELLSNLPIDELVRIAESMVAAK